MLWSLVIILIGQYTVMSGLHLWVMGTVRDDFSSVIDWKTLVTIMAVSMLFWFLWLVGLYGLSSISSGLYTMAWYVARKE